ncbi:cupin domain-containing protein [Tersicoccus sp. Bi-70]|uniref:cupin domain-containing protein n=1 Tax=Tersicoccus sp. Bi-70 TaxID=1897634 RepID=UPI0009FA0E94|nr:cupin domain-containing protein [Tersicoccus sp. Bi-70]
MSHIVTQPVTLAAAAADLDSYWSQRVVASANGSLVKVAKGIGEVNWHHHDDQDELFLVLEGELTVRLRDDERDPAAERAVRLATGDLFVVPQGVEHAPVAREEARFMIMGRSITSTAAGGKPAWSEVPPAS